MELEREKVNLLANCIMDFVTFINESYDAKYRNFSNPDKLFRLKLITEEFHFNTIASELLRLNSQCLEEQQTRVLIARFKKAFGDVVDYFEHNQSDLFLFSGRVYTLEHYCQLFNTENTSELFEKD
jgi:hypothetical protein